MLTDNSPSSPPPEEPFFVGYAKPPLALRRWLWLVGVVVLLGGAVSAGVIAWAQRDPGPAKWDTDSVQTLEGVVVLEPYPMIVNAGQPPVLLVGPTKQGAASWVSPWAGRRVQLMGHSLKRGALVLFSISDEGGSIRPVEGPVTSPPVVGTMGRISLEGEIVDPKCFGGAMKPGDGKAHKACAALCIRGGIPPVLIVRRDGTLTAWLLVDAGGSGVRGPLLDRLVDLVGEPVRVDGQAGDLQGLRILRVDRVEAVSASSDQSGAAKDLASVTANYPAASN